MLALLLKSSLIIIALWAFYKAVLEKESFFALNRVYLISCLLLATFLPFVQLPELISQQGYLSEWISSLEGEESIVDTQKETVKEERFSPPMSLEERNVAREARAEERMKEAPAEQAVPTVASESPSSFSAEEESATATVNPIVKRGIGFWVAVLYIFGVLVLTINLLAQVFNTLRKAMVSTDKVPDKEGTIVNMNTEVEPCSFFNYIFINPASYDFETYEQIIAHEKIHVAQKHSLDLLLSEMAVIFLWFNPFVWLLRKEVEKNIEYQTDDLLLKQEAEEKEIYQMNLLKIATYTHPLSITTNYNQSLLKQRILRMNAKKSNDYAYWKYSFLFPLLFGLVLFMNKPASVLAQSSYTLPELIAPFFTTQEEDHEVEVASEEGSEDNFNEFGVIDTIPAEIFGEEEDQNNSFSILDRDRLPADLQEAIEDGIRLAESIVQKEVELNDFESHDESYLIKAVRENDMDMVLLLLDRGADVNERTEDGMTPLICAVNEGNLEIVKLLISRGAKVNVQDNEGWSPLMEALDESSYELADYLLKRTADPNLKMNNGKVPLMEAIEHSEVDLVRLLVAHGADINIKDNMGWTPFLDAVYEGNIEILELFHERGADVNVLTNQGKNALLIGLERKEPEIVLFLLRIGVDIEGVTRSLEPTLLEALKKEDQQKLFELLENERYDPFGDQFEIYILDDESDSDHDVDVEFHQEEEDPGDPECRELLRAVKQNNVNKVMELARTANCNCVYKGDGEPRSPLVAAAREGYWAIGKILLEEDAHTEYHYTGDESALMAAAANGHMDFVKMLLEAGADINRKVSGDGTALLVAAKFGKSAIVEYLIAQGAEVNAVVPGDGTPLINAVRRQEYNIAKILMRHGADPYLQSPGDEYAMYHAVKANDKKMMEILNGKR